MSEFSHTRTEPAPRPGGAHASLHHSPEPILVVDDDANVRESLGDVLTHEQYAVSVEERTFGWLGRYRRLNRDYERQATSGETRSLQTRGRRYFPL